MAPPQHERPEISQHPASEAPIRRMDLAREDARQQQVEQPRRQLPLMLVAGDQGDATQRHHHVVGGQVVLEVRARFQERRDGVAQQRRGSRRAAPRGRRGCSAAPRTCRAWSACSRRIGRPTRAGPRPAPPSGAARTRSPTAASSRCGRSPRSGPRGVGKRRYSVPMPTPAACAMAFSDVSAPSRANARGRHLQHAVVIELRVSPQATSSHEASSLHPEPTPLICRR